ncbi:venom acid phosphatase Acph-1 [Amyelois transitella]|uniref:venom acid phosphatase Acph-1 n=1 Tax=Amyelois transitella TaxID=680683 RepID=UPI00067D1E1A|nr:venom acid phosphatase Acph-1 [Amyelois transitella]
MRAVYVVIAFVATIAWGLDATTAGLVVEHTAALAMPDDVADTELVAAFVIFRHGDRTPDQEELDLLTKGEKHKDVFFPYGMKALTNKGKQCGYRVGQYIRERYDGFISRLYLPDEIVVRTTNFDRTKMTALSALAAIYPPLPAQKWNPDLDWQPVPYNTIDANIDDLLYWYNCPLYLKKRAQVYEETPEIQSWVRPYEKLFAYLSEKTGSNITTSIDTFYLDNLFQTLENVGIKPPKWAQVVMPQIQQLTKIEYAVEYYTTELKRISAGVLMTEIIDSMNYAIKGYEDQPKMRLYSAHENNVAALMAAAKVFVPHQPSYGSTFSLELRRRNSTGEFVVAAPYAKDAGGPAELLPFEGCGESLLCDYDTFSTLVADSLMSYDEFKRVCAISD